MPTAAEAQLRISSPYSRYGLGDLHLNNSSTLMGMGQTGQALALPVMVNFSNPATYSAIEQNSFVFEAGMYNKLARLRTESLSQSSNYTTFGNLVMAFPVNKFMRASLGLLPYSDVGYKISDLRSDTIIGSYSQQSEGTGGLNQFYAGTSISLGKQLAVGINLVYLFGTLEKSRSITFPEAPTTISTRILNTTRISDLKLKTGILYNKDLKENYKLSLGLTISPETKINIRDNILAYNYFPGSAGIDKILDTIINTPSAKGKMVMPVEVGAGVVLQKTNRWLLAADYRWQNWENFTYFDRSDSLKNSMGVSLGGQYIPESTTLSPYWRKMRYRFGIRYSQSYLELHERRLNEFGISFGTSLPMIRTRSTINLGMEVGRRGTTAKDLIEETFFRFTIGVSLIERWFEQRKYY